LFKDRVALAQDGIKQVVASDHLLTGETLRQFAVGTDRVLEESVADARGRQLGISMGQSFPMALCRVRNCERGASPSVMTVASHFATNPVRQWSQKLMVRLTLGHRESFSHNGVEHVPFTCRPRRPRLRTEVARRASCPPG
jgi:hypothetical protein